MKILVLQLARFGDIYLTWPTLRALARQNPNAEIHLLVRERFMAATAGLGGQFHVHVLPTQRILGPVLENGNFDVSLFELEEWTEDLAAQSWDRIINLSFSPASSYLVDLLRSESTSVRGYARHADGFLNIPDDASSYFYAQVGPGGYNRYHLVDLFAMVSDVGVTQDDFGVDGLEPSATKKGLVIHLGASTEDKRFPLPKWQRVLSSLKDYRVTLIGSADEAEFARGLDVSANVINLIGQTNLVELFGVLASAELLIGADSAPIHMASHVGTKVLNLSMPSVRFWETGPCHHPTYCMPAGDAEAQDVVEAIRGCLVDAPTLRLVKSRSAEGVRFEVDRVLPSDFSWNLTLALYTAHDFPLITNAKVRSAFAKLDEVVDLAFQQFDLFKSGQADLAAQMLPMVDQLITEIGSLTPEISPLIRWFQTQQLRMAPGTLAATLTETERLFTDLKCITALYQQSSRGLEAKAWKTRGLWLISDIPSRLNACAKSFRFMHLAEAEPRFRLLLEELAFFDVDAASVWPTKVESWENCSGLYKNLLRELIDAFERKDYVFVADLIEYQLPVCLDEWKSELENPALDVLE